jgi:hypothetical protein
MFARSRGERRRAGRGGIVMVRGRDGGGLSLLLLVASGGIVVLFRIVVSFGIVVPEVVLCGRSGGEGGVTVILGRSVVVEDVGAEIGRGKSSVSLMVLLVTESLGSEEKG